MCEEHGNSNYFAHYYKSYDCPNASESPLKVMVQSDQHQTTMKPTKVQLMCIILEIQSIWYLYIPVIDISQSLWLQLSLPSWYELLLCIYLGIYIFQLSAQPCNSQTTVSDISMGSDTDRQNKEIIPSALNISQIPIQFLRCVRQTVMTQWIFFYFGSLL